MEQELTKKTQDGGSSSDSLSPAAQKAYIETLARTLTTSSDRGPIRPEDVVRKSEVRCGHSNLPDITNPAHIILLLSIN